MLFSVKARAPLGCIEVMQQVFPNLCILVYKVRLILLLSTLSTKATCHNHLRSESHNSFTHRNCDITALQTSVKSLEPTTETVSIPDGSTSINIQPKLANIVPTNKPTFLVTIYKDKKYIVVMYGIKESPPKKSKSDHLENDLQSITNEFAKVELPIQANSAKDCF